jgi:putative ABC transport system substrate-binding protein
LRYGSPTTYKLSYSSFIGAELFTENNVKRRNFLAVLFGGAATLNMSPGARAQPAMPVIGLLCGGTAETDAYRLNAFKQGLSEGGYTEGRNVAFEYRWAELHYDRLPALATELDSARST